MSWPTRQGFFALGELPLMSGGVLPAARLSWKAYGTLSSARDNVVVYPTSYSAQHQDIEWAIGPSSVLDPNRWFIVIADMFGNGLSSSPSNTQNYPELVTAEDNVLAQQRLLREVFGVDRIACAYGFSMEPSRLIIGPRSSLMSRIAQSSSAAVRELPCIIVSSSRG